MTRIARSARRRAVPPLKGVMPVLEDEWASSRIVGDPHSSVVDLPLTAVQGELLSIAAWYDNEMGYSTRLADTAARLAAAISQLDAVESSV
jgi:glyceraldehyde 3-phosphate dehydrogenase